MKRKILYIIPIILIVSCIFLLFYDNKKLTIMIDPGHGDQDPGTISIHGTYEKDINLSLAKKTAETLAKQGHTIILTRHEDTTMSLKERYQLANEKQVDLFISVHANAIENKPDIHGMQVLYYPDETNRNEVLASEMLKYLLTTTNAVDKGAIARPDLAVLRGTTMPSLLIESGFLTNAQEATRLEDPNYQQKIADGVAQAVQHYFDEELIVKNQK